MLTPRQSIKDMRHVSNVFTSSNFKVCPNRLSEKDAVCSAAGRKVDARRRWKFYDDSTGLLFLEKIPIKLNKFHIKQLIDPLRSCKKK